MSVPLCVWVCVCVLQCACCMGVCCLCGRPCLELCASLCACVPVVVSDCVHVYVCVSQCACCRKRPAPVPADITMVANPVRAWDKKGGAHTHTPEVVEVAPPLRIAKSFFYKGGWKWLFLSYNAVCVCVRMSVCVCVCECVV